MNRCCINWKAGECTLDAARTETGPKPSEGVCARCAHYSGPPRGLGDVVHTVAVALGIPKVTQKVAKSCGCEERRRMLNKAVPMSFSENYKKSDESAQGS